MLDDREWFVEVVQQASPLLIRGRTPEALGVVFEGVPLDQQEIARGTLQAVLEAHGPASLGRGDDRAGGAERRLEAFLLTGDHVEDRVFEDHHVTLTPVAAAAPIGSQGWADRTGI